MINFHSKIIVTPKQPRRKSGMTHPGNVFHMQSLLKFSLEKIMKYPADSAVLSLMMNFNATKLIT